MHPHRQIDDPTLGAHLRAWLGAWPPPGEGLVEVASSPARDDPSAAWDGQARPLLGLLVPGHGAVVSVPAARVAEVRALRAPLADRPGLAAAAGLDLDALFEATFRWTRTPAPASVLADAGQWVAPDDPRLTDWLRPFQLVLAAWAPGSTSQLAAAVGVKVHDEHGWELAVGTEEAHRGSGFARRLVAQAARRAVDEGRVATYLHADDNVPSGRVADAAGFPDEGWRVVGSSAG